MLLFFSFCVVCVVLCQGHVWKIVGERIVGILKGVGRKGSHVHYGVGVRGVEGYVGRVLRKILLHLLQAESFGGVMQQSQVLRHFGTRVVVVLFVMRRVIVASAPWAKTAHQPSPQTALPGQPWSRTAEATAF